MCMFHLVCLVSFFQFKNEGCIQRKQIEKNKAEAESFISKEKVEEDDSLESYYPISFFIEVRILSAFGVTTDEVSCEFSCGLSISILLKQKYSSGYRILRFPQQCKL